MDSYSTSTVHLIAKHELHILVKAESIMWYSGTISLVTDPDAFVKDHSEYVRSVSIYS